ncbi:MAG: hypothetical protein EHM42_12230 [Planctomycetaceae bacterium]|nr:MAG: hypothetical protein EHM42_12230 [Planctomycetaceae bacterium]
MLAWSEPWVSGLDLDPGRQLNGAALVTMPLTIRRPTPGTEFAVPSPLLPFRNLRGSGPDGQVSSALWNFARNEGAERDLPGTTWLQFQAPTSLIPFEALSARVRIDVSGPMGLLELAGWKNGALEVLKTWRDPAGPLTFEITDPDVLKITDGSFILRFSAGDPSRPELTSRTENGQVLKSTWKMESLSVDLKARTLANDGS